ncbi:CYTH domain-containing protein [Lactobacillus sp. PSON]|uniref:CYTH domain-containing protein n=1 Tax=Lactobacillus sp. PSON TaxID=3455454 RepID=UPI0040411A94
MSKNREIESKTILNKNVFDELVNAFLVKEDFIQKNYYFDSPNQVLKNNRIAGRIRIFSDKAEQTLKVPEKNPLQVKFHEVIEINDKLEVRDADSLVKQAEAGQAIQFTGSVGAYLSKHFADQIFLLQTWSKTHRRLLIGPQNCELTLDETTYPDGYSDYELEIENSDPALIKKVLIQLDKEYHFKQAADRTNQSKIGRAFAHRN